MLKCNSLALVGVAVLVRHLEDPIIIRPIEDFLDVPNIRVVLDFNVELLGVVIQVLQDGGSVGEEVFGVMSVEQGIIV